MWRRPVPVPRLGRRGRRVARAVWIKLAEPAAFARLTRVIECKDDLVRLLTGVVASRRATASIAASVCAIVAGSSVTLV